MANGHGGARIGAGQKKKALADKIAGGNPGKRKLTKMENLLKKSTLPDIHV